MNEQIFTVMEFSGRGDAMFGGSAADWRKPTFGALTAFKWFYGAGSEGLVAVQTIAIPANPAGAGRSMGARPLP